MHEAAIAQGIVEEVERLRVEGVWRGRLVRVHLRLGKLTAVVPDYLAFSFRAAVEGTPLAGVEVAWEDVPVRGLCLACGETSEFSAVGFLCLTCGSPRVQITAGRELLIDSLEVDEDGP